MAENIKWKIHAMDKAMQDLKEHQEQMNDFEYRFNNQMPDTWIKNDTWLGEQTLKHSFDGLTVGFGISHSDPDLNPKLIFFQEFEGYGALGSDYEVKGDINTVKQLVNTAINHFDQKQNVGFDDISNYLGTQIDQHNEQTMSGDLQKQKTEQNQPPNPEIETARKAGYVQGVCECVAIVGNDHALGKKLLSEMKVTKDMAQKFAKPETYKELEQGIFAPKQEQTLEQTQSHGRKC